MPTGPGERYDFFLSHRGSVAAIAREVADVLTDKGYKVSSCRTMTSRSVRALSTRCMMASRTRVVVSFRRALAVRERVLGPEHPDTATSLNDYAELLRVQGDPGKAQPLYERALAIYEMTLGPEHPWTATSIIGLAQVLQAMGNNADAQRLFGRHREM
jgi:tetratricopeptide (TPR) repeat protein